MKVLVTSPLHSVGTTTTSFIISEATSLILGRRTLLTHIDLNNDCIGSLVGKTKDVTQVQTSLSQIGCLLESNQISPLDMISYTREINKTLFAYSPIPIIKEESEIKRLWKMFHNNTSEFKFTIIDSDTSNNSDMTQTFRDMAELVFIVINHDPRSHLQASSLADKFTDIKENIRTSSLKSRKIYYIVNGYNENIEHLSKIARRLNQRPANLITLPYDENIPKYSIKGSLQDYILQSIKGTANQKLGQSIKRLANEINPSWYKIAEKAVRENRKGIRK